MMKPQPRICDLIPAAMFEGFLLVKDAQERINVKGAKYLDINLTDITGEINAKKWDNVDFIPSAGQVVKIRGQVGEFNNRMQLRIDRMRESTPEDEVEMPLLIPCAPRKPEDMMEDIIARVAEMENAQLKQLVNRLLDEAGDAIFYMPAAKSLHHAQRSGLLNHTTTMLKGARAVCDIYPFLDSDLLAAGVIIHDLCKIEELRSDEIGLVSDYTVEGNLLGHIVMGVSRLDRIGRELGTDRELLVMLEHMVLSHHDLPEYGSPKPPMFPEAEALHILDLLDARMFEMNSELEKVNPGAFTDRIWSLERKLYRRQDTEAAEE